MTGATTANAGSAGRANRQTDDIATARDSFDDKSFLYDAFISYTSTPKRDRAVVSPRLD